MRPGSVLIVEDHALLADALALALRAEGHRVDVVRPTGPAAVLAAAASGPALVLLDLDLGPAVGNALPLVRPLATTGALVVLLTGETAEARLGACLEAGAHGILPKSLPYPALLAGVEAALAGRPLHSREERDALLAAAARRRGERAGGRDRLARLTPRERAVLRDLIEGHQAEEIARRSHTSVATVRTHIRQVLRKLGVPSQLAAVALARRHGWPDDQP